MNGTKGTYTKDTARPASRKAAGKLSSVPSTVVIAASVVLLASSAVSCVRNEPAPGPDSGTPKEISFSLTPVKTGTKAATFSSFPADSTFGTFAWYLPSGKRWATDSESAVAWIGKTGQDGKTEPERISYRSGLWKAWESGKSYWWPQGGRLSFFSWAPANLTERGLSINTSEGLRIDGWKVPNTPGYGGSTNYGGAKPADGSTDILTAMSLDLGGNTSNTWESGSESSFTGYGAKIQFTHALCKVRFVIRLDYRSEDDTKKWYVEKAELKDIYTEGTLTGSTWGDYPWSGMTDYSFSLMTGEDAGNGLEVTADEDKTIFPKTMMIPQPLASSVSGTKERRPRIEITVWDGTMKDVDDGTGSLVQVKDTQVLTGMLYSNTAESARWNESTDITYHIYLSTGTENYIEFDATVGSWSDIIDGGDIELR